MNRFESKPPASWARPRNSPNCPPSSCNCPCVGPPPWSEITFTTHKPTDGEYSTIYIGGNSDAFGKIYYGLSEKVDQGNRDHSDNAFVFTQNIDARGLSAAEYGAKVADVAAHELGHLLGYEYQDTDVMSATLAAGIRLTPGQDATDWWFAHSAAEVND